MRLEARVVHFIQSQHTVLPTQGRLVGIDLLPGGMPAGERYKTWIRECRA